MVLISKMNFWEISSADSLAMHIGPQPFLFSPPYSQDSSPVSPCAYKTFRKTLRGLSHFPPSDQIF